MDELSSNSESAENTSIFVHLSLKLNIYAFSHNRFYGLNLKTVYFCVFPRGLGVRYQCHLVKEKYKLLECAIILYALFLFKKFGKNL